MDRLKPRRFVKKAGLQVPGHVLRLMQKLHPTVDILWAWKDQCFCLVQNVRGVQKVIRRLNPKHGITLSNTVYALNKMHPSHFQSHWARERFLRQLDDNPEVERVRRNSRGMIAEGSKDLFNAINRRVVVTRPK